MQGNRSWSLLMLPIQYCPTHSATPENCFSSCLLTSNTNQTILFMCTLFCLDDHFTERIKALKELCSFKKAYNMGSSASSLYSAFFSVTMDTPSWPILREVLHFYKATNNLSLVQGYYVNISLVVPLYYQFSILCLSFLTFKHLFCLKNLVQQDPFLYVLPPCLYHPGFCVYSRNP